MKDFKPELGQMAFGNPWAPYECPDFVDALVFHLARESSRVDGNVRQKAGWTAWEHFVPVQEVVIAGLTWRPYFWGDGDASLLPNMSFEDVEIRWYKHMGRSMSVNVEKTPAEWVAWFDRAMSLLRETDRCKWG